MQYLVQDLILLALNPQTGRLRSSASSGLSGLSYSLMGAVLLDLVLQEKLAIDTTLMVINASTTGDDFLDQCLNDVLASPPRTVKFWVKHWRRKYSEFPNIVLQNLVDLGVLSRQDQRVLGVFPVRRYFLTDASVRQALVEQVRAAVLADIGLDSRMAGLISLIHACRLTNTLFMPEERRQARSRIQAIARGEQVGKAVSDTVANLHVTIAAINASIAASAVSSASSNN